MKKVLSVLLSFAIFICIIPLFSFSADAATYDLSSMRSRAEAIVNYQWVPSQRIATWNGNTYNGKAYFEKGETIKGMPYTLFSSELGFDSLLSLEQYKSKASVNYSTTEYCVSVSENRTGPAYGSCCATFVSEVFGGDFMSGSNPKYDSV